MSLSLLLCFFFCYSIDSLHGARHKIIFLGIIRFIKHKWVSSRHTYFRDPLVLWEKIPWSSSSLDRGDLTSQLYNQSPIHAHMTLLKTYQSNLCNTPYLYVLYYRITPHFFPFAISHNSLSSSNFNTYIFLALLI